MTTDTGAAETSGHRETSVPVGATGDPLVQQRSDIVAAAWSRRLAIALCLLLVLSILVPAASAQERDLASSGLGDPYFRSLGNPGYDVQDYYVNLRINPKTTASRARRELR